MTLKRSPKKAAHFPLWLESIIIATLLIMSVVEGLHDQTFFAIIFGVAGCCFTISLISRVIEKNDPGSP